MQRVIIIGGASAATVRSRGFIFVRFGPAEKCHNFNFYSPHMLYCRD